MLGGEIIFPCLQQGIRFIGDDYTYIIHKKIYKYKVIMYNMLAGNMDIEKYLRKDGKKKKKKAYTLYLNEENVEFLRKNLKVPVSFLINDFFEHIAKKIKEEIKKDDDNKKS